VYVALETQGCLVYVALETQGCLGHNNAGPAPGWYLDHIIVDAENSGKKKRVLFPCHRWLAKSADDGKFFRYLKPEFDRWLDAKNGQSASKAPKK